MCFCKSCQLHGMRRQREEVNLKCHCRKQTNILKSNSKQEKDQPETVMWLKEKDKYGQTMNYIASLLELRCAVILHNVFVS